MAEGLRLLASVIATGGVGALLNANPEHFTTAERPAYDFIRSHYRRHRELPVAATLQEETGIRLPNAPESLGYYQERFLDRAEFNIFREAYGELRTHAAESGQAMPAIKTRIARLNRDLNRVAPQSNVSRIDDAMAEVMEDLDATRGYGGITGIETGWPSYDTITGGYQDTDLITIVGRMGLGKCMDPATPVIMYGGAVRAIGKLKVGDLLTGPDSKPRTVLSTVRGHDPMYRVTPRRGDSFVCNGAHILVLACDFDLDRMHTKGSTHLYSVDEYMNLPSRVQKILRLVRTAVEFPHEDTEVTPYYTGVWLGDGCVANGRISTPDLEIRAAVYAEADRFGMKVVQHEHRVGFCPQYALVGTRGKDNEVMDFFRRDCYRDGEKRISGRYLRNSRAARLELLAGLIDTDGWLHNEGTGFEIATKYPGLRDDICYLVRSLGLCAVHSIKTVNGVDYQRIYITGPIHTIPTRVPRKQAIEAPRRSNVLHQTFTVESLGEGEYAGITLDGDHLYLLGDFTVTHNTYVLLKQADFAHSAGESILFVTTEMGNKQIARRHLSIGLGINPHVLKTNQISTYTERRIRSFYQEMAGAERFNLFSVGRNSKIDAIEAFAQEYGPTVIYVDGGYLLQPVEGHKSMNRIERITQVWNELLALKTALGIPIIVTSQFNRGAGKGGKDGTLETVAFSDAIGMNSAIVVALKAGPTENPKASREFDFLKGREGEEGQVAINFKFAPLDMSEITDQQAQAEGVQPASDLTWMR